MTNEQCITLGKVLQVFGDRIEAIDFSPRMERGAVRLKNRKNYRLYIMPNGDLLQPQDVHVYLDDESFLSSLEE